MEKRKTYKTKHAPKRLYRSRKEVMIIGILGGLGEYLNVDPTIIRVIAVILIMLTGIFPGIITYFLLALIIPENPYQ